MVQFVQQAQAVQEAQVVQALHGHQGSQQDHLCLDIPAKVNIFVDIGFILVCIYPIKAVIIYIIPISDKWLTI